MEVVTSACHDGTGKIYGEMPFPKRLEFFKAGRSFHDAQRHLPALDCKPDKIAIERKLPTVRPRVNEKLSSVPVRSLHSSCHSVSPSST